MTMSETGREVRTMAEETRKFATLSATEPQANIDVYGHVLGNGEQVLMEFKSFRDVCVITDRKIIAVNVQGLTGKKKEVLVLPYSKMTAYAVESSGTFDLDAELKVWSSGIGLVSFEFVKGTVDIRQIAHVLADYIG